MKFPALYRRYPEAPIIVTEYDCATQSVLDLKFPVPFNWSKDHQVEMAHVDQHKLQMMYQAFLERKEVLAVVLVNNDYVSMLYPNRVFTIQSKHENAENQDNFFTKSFYDYSDIQKETLIPVGFERTFCLTKMTLIPPGRIFYSSERKSIFYKNKWCPVDFVPQEFKKKSLYKELVETEKGHGIVYLGDNKSQKIL